MDYNKLLLNCKIGIVILSLLSLIIIMLGFLSNRESLLKNEVKQMHLDNRREQFADIEEIILDEHDDFPFRFFKFTSSHLKAAYPEE